MRIVAVLLVAMAVALPLAPTADAAAPTLRVLPGTTLAVQGAGFVPRSLVRLRVTDSGVVLRVVLVRAGARGGFVVRLPTVDTCAPTQITATGVGGRQARVPTPWFVRECPPPPPLEPGVPPPIRYPGSG